MTITTKHAIIVVYLFTIYISYLSPLRCNKFHNNYYQNTKATTNKSTPYNNLNDDTNNYQYNSNNTEYTEEENTQSDGEEIIVEEVYESINGEEVIEVIAYEESTAISETSKTETNGTSDTNDINSDDSDSYYIQDGYITDKEDKKNKTWIIIVAPIVVLLISIISIVCYKRRKNSVNNSINENPESQSRLGNQNIAIENINHNVSDNSDKNKINSNNISNEIEIIATNSENSNVLKCKLCDTNDSSHKLFPCQCLVCLACAENAFKIENKCTACNELCSSYEEISIGVENCGICKENKSQIILKCGNKHKVCKICYKEMKERKLNCHICRNEVKY